MAKQKTATLINGRLISTEIKDEIKAEVAQMLDNEEKAPHLVAVIVGEDPASQSYVSGKEKAAHRVGMISSVYKFPANTTEKELLNTIDFLNQTQA